MLQSYFKNGLWEHYYSNGQLRYSTFFNRGKHIDGIYKEFYSNGQIAILGRYENGIKVGLWEFFDRNGSIESTEFWKDGTNQPDGSFPITRYSISKNLYTCEPLE